VRRRLALAAAVLLAAAAAPAAAEPGSEEDYVLHCSGCHRLDGSGAPGVAPGLRDLGGLLGTPGGRAYLVRVPGVAQAPLDDARLARLLNFVLGEMGASPALPPYGPEEVGRLRRSPLRDPRAERARLAPP
jgi:mono/diheme cytochrome c family protein